MRTAALPVVRQRRRTDALLKSTFVCAAMAAALASVPAHAVLGGDAASIQQDKAVLAASQSSSASAKRAGASASASSATVTATTHLVTPSGVAYTVDTLTTDADTVVHEYATADGKVFALAWSGPRRPDLRQLLGTHFEKLAEASAASSASATAVTRMTRGPRRYTTDDLVVQSTGALRAFTGFAYLKSALPAGFTVDLIR